MHFKLSILSFTLFVPVIFASASELSEQSSTESYVSFEVWQHVTNLEFAIDDLEESISSLGVCHTTWGGGVRTRCLTPQLHIFKSFFISLLTLEKANSIWSVWSDEKQGDICKLDVGSQDPKCLQAKIEETRRIIQGLKPEDFRINLTPQKAK